MTKKNTRKQELDKQRTEWRRNHRALNGKIILYPDKPPEHINARGNKIYNWFWNNILLSSNMYDIPALISSIKQRITHENDGRKIRTFRTMIGMADDAYKLKQLEDIDIIDSELQIGPSSFYNSDQGIIYKDEGYYTFDFTEKEDKILVRDMEGIIIDIQYNGNGKKEDKIISSPSSIETYRDWNYTKGN